MQRIPCMLLGFFPEPHYSSTKDRGPWLRDWGMTATTEDLTKIWLDNRNRTLSLKTLFKHRSKQYKGEEQGNEGILFLQ